MFHARIEPYIEQAVLVDKRKVWGNKGKGEWVSGIGTCSNSVCASKVGEARERKVWKYQV